MLKGSIAIKYINDIAFHGNTKYWSPRQWRIDLDRLSRGLNGSIFLIRRPLILSGYAFPTTKRYVNYKFKFELTKKHTTTLLWSNANSWMQKFSVLTAYFGLRMCATFDKPIQISSENCSAYTPQSLRFGCFGPGVGSVTQLSTNFK